MANTFSRFLVLLTVCTLLLAGCTQTAPSAAGRSLIVYYSSGNDGISELAESVAAAAEADLFEIQPKKDYSSLLAKIDQGEELNVDELRDLFSFDLKMEQPIPNDWNQYSHIYVGTPIWIQGPATPVRLFLEENDLENKTLYLFTIGTQAEAESLQDILSCSGKRVTWRDPIGFSASWTTDEIRNWLVQTAVQPSAIPE